ncbi:MAG: TonB-dependent receptor [Bacteroidia bacterium]|nr:TonB-dependent receptor [Bacteroidia bacterium]
MKYNIGNMLKIDEKFYRIKSLNMKSYYLHYQKLLFYVLLFCLLLPVTAYGQTLKISGKVTHSVTGIGIGGVTVLEKGTRNGVITRDDGGYEIEVSEGSTLVFSMVGMEASEIIVQKDGNFDVRLAEKVVTLDEVVVVGYGTKSKKDVTGAISQISSARLETRNLKSVGEALQGEIAGVQVTTAARPGDAATIRIRGYGSVPEGGNNTPLILVDGQEVGTFTTVDPNDIENISVLKDASSAAIYGYRAANGVILITTKKGKFGSQTINYNTFFGYQEATNKVEMLNADQYVTLLNEATDNAGLPRFYNEQETASWAGKEGTNWQNELLQRGFMQNHHLTFSNGTATSNYSLSLGVLDQDGIYLNTNFKRYNFRVNAENTFKKRLKIGETLTFNHSLQNTGGDYYISRIFILQPTIPVRTDDGWYGAGNPSKGETTLKNPVAMSELIHWENTQTHFFGTVYGDLEISKGLNFRSAFRLDRRLTEKDYYEPSYTLGFVTQEAFADMADFKDLTWDWDNYLTYKRVLGKNHRIDVLAGSWARHHRNNWFLAKGFGFPSDLISTIGSVTTNLEIQGSWTEYKMFSYFGRFDYTFKDRYFLSATLRRDGSSRFSKDNRWGTFPSVGLSWVVSEEKFMQSLQPVLNSAKFRGSWGLLGNSAIGDYEYHSIVNFGLNYVFGNGQNLALGGAPLALANEDIRWETTEQYNIGIDLGFLSEKLTVKTDVYLKNTYDILLYVPVPATTGASNASRQNVGQVQNKGLELEIAYADKIGALNFRTGFNIAFLKNEVIDFGGISWTTGRDGTSNLYRAGYPLRTIYGYKTDGIFQTPEEVDVKPHVEGAEPGDLIFVDVSGPQGTPDGKIDAFDRTTLGQTIPKYTLGYNLGINIKGFDVTGLLQGAFGHSIMLANANFGGGRSFLDFAENLVAERMDRWHGPGTSNTMPRVYYGGSPNDNNRNSDFFVEDASYLRLKNIQIGFTLPADFSKKIGIARLRVYVGATDILTFTHYSGFDPEIPMEGSDSFGWDYPMAKTMLTGLNLDL